MALQLQPQSISKFISNLSTMADSNLVDVSSSVLTSNTTSLEVAPISMSESAPISPKPPSKRQRKSSSPISISSTPPRQTTSGSISGNRSGSGGSSTRGGTRFFSKSERDAFLDAVEAGDAYPMPAMPISSADELSDAQLKKLFEVLHACGSATDTNASLKTTRQSIDGFLEAVFNDWSSRKPGNLLKAELEFLVEAEVEAGMVCEVPALHATFDDCYSSKSCTSGITAVATYSNNPPMFKLEYCTPDQLSGEPEAICTISQAHAIRWIPKATNNWMSALRKGLCAKIVTKMHKYNKHLAVWQARKLIVEWAKGSLDMGLDVKHMGFLEREAADVALLGLGGHEVDN